MNIKQILEKLIGFNEHAWKNACGKELTKEITEEIRKSYSKLPELKFENLDAKISWLINYIDIIPKENIIGLKISNIGTVYWKEDNKLKESEIVLALGDVGSNGIVISSSNHGLYHMKYGQNKHWEASKKALHLIPRAIKEGKQVPGDTPYKYNIIYKDKRTHKVYVIGIPSMYGDETVLISCL